LRVIRLNFFSSFLDPLKDLQTIKGQVAGIKTQIDTCAKSNPPDQAFIDAFQAFYDKAAREIAEAEKQGIETKNLYIQVGL